MNRIAVFPGSFDPVTIGHYDIIQRALPLFDKLIIGVGVNSQKKYLFPLEQRLQWLQLLLGHEQKVQIQSYTGLTVHFCLLQGAQYIVRGIRSSSDFEFEKMVSQTNFTLHPHIETVFFLARPATAPVSSSMVRDILLNGGDASAFVPEAIRSQVHL